MTLDGPTYRHSLANTFAIPQKPKMPEQTAHVLLANRTYTLTQPYQIRDLLLFTIILIFATISHPTLNYFVSCSMQDDSTTTETIQTLSATPDTREQMQSAAKQAAALRASDALDAARDWASKFGNDVHYGTREITNFRCIQAEFEPAKYDDSKHKPYKSSVVAIKWTETHSGIVRKVSTTMGWYQEAVEAISRESERLAAEHDYNKTLNFNYTDVHRLYDIDEDPSLSESSNEDSLALTDTIRDPVDTGEDGNLDGLSATTPALQNQNNQQDARQSDDADGLEGNNNALETLPTPSRANASSRSRRSSSNAQPAAGAGSGGDSPAPGSFVEFQTPVKYLKLSKHRNFDVLVNTDESAVHVPVHIYPGDANVINGIAWSEQLTKRFRENFARNPKLTNQYFASQYGFLRLFPAQKWQIARTDPDLYDARMRPWYAAGASSRKDVVILVDSSGSMTGSRRDIAKGVVFEILDTLTDNDHFMILKFSDSVQQVGVPGCAKMRVARRPPNIPARNVATQLDAARLQAAQSGSMMGLNASGNIAADLLQSVNETDIESLFLAPASGRNVRHVKTNFTIPTSGIANFSRALVTAFEVLRKYQDTDTLGSKCNQAIMLITDGSPSDFEDIFRWYNYPNAPVRVFTYLIGRDAGDMSNTKMMACHNRGYYTHVINLAEVRETVQQYIPVMARPLVLNGTHPITWTPAYGELTYQILTDWIWESKRRERAKSILAAYKPAYNDARLLPTPSALVQSARGVPAEIHVTNDDGLGSQYGGGGSGASSGMADDGSSIAYSEASIEAEMDHIDLFGYVHDTRCFWQTHRNDLLTTVVQPVYDRHNETLITEKFLLKNVWVSKETPMRTAQLLGVAAADMKVNDIVALAPSHLLGANGYAIMLTNNGYAMHHPDLRSILEPFTSEESERNMRLLKPFFSSLDFTQVEHIASSQDELKFTRMRHEAVDGKEGLSELYTKRALDCQRRAQTRKQKFYYKTVEQFPFSFLIAIPQPYGSHRLHAQVDLMNLAKDPLPERVSTYFQNSDFDAWTVHPDYQYCDGTSNNTITTLLDLINRVDQNLLQDVQWKPAESRSPPLFLPSKIVCDKDLVQSLVFDAVATLGFSDQSCPPEPGDKPSLLAASGARFAFISTRSGLTRVRHFDSNDSSVRMEAFAFARRHARAIDETYYARTVDYNMLINDSATLIQVPFNTHVKIQDRLREIGQLQDEVVAHTDLFDKLRAITNSSVHVIASEAIIVREGAERAVAGVAGVFYDYASFVLHFLEATNAMRAEKDPSERRTAPKPAECYTGNRNNLASPDGQPSVCGDIPLNEPIKCGFSNDTIDCLLVDNNGFIIVSEQVEFIGRHLKAYQPSIMSKLVSAGVFHEINITDYQSVCMRAEEPGASAAGKQTSSALSKLLFRPNSILSPAMLLQTFWSNTFNVLMHTWSIAVALTLNLFTNHAEAATNQQWSASAALLPNKTYLRPCHKTLVLYETRPGRYGSEMPEYYDNKCNCDAWFVYEQVPATNLLLIIVDSAKDTCKDCDLTGSNPIDAQVDPIDPLEVIDTNSSAEEQVCSMLERESMLHRKQLASCFDHHADEEHIKLCGSAARSSSVSQISMILCLIAFVFVMLKAHEQHQNFH